MNAIYRTVGISKQSFHQWSDRMLTRYEEQEQLLPIIRQIREDHPRLSCRKIYLKLKPNYMGRDRFEHFCHNNGFKLDVKKRRYRTTDSRGVIYFPNLLLNLDELTGINQLWVSDITYFDIGKQVYYLTFITDIYNREIVGYCASKTLRTEETTMIALKMAIKHRNIQKESDLIIHSDGGGQYYCKDFVRLTKTYGMNNSMGKTAFENPHAERLNGTIKNDYLIYYQPKDFIELKKMLIKAVNMYNQYRPHQSLSEHSPCEFNDLINDGLLTKTWIVNKKKIESKKEKVNIFIT